MSFFSGKWSIAALWIVLAGLGSSVFTSAQSISFFGAFNSYTQNVVEYPQGIAADVSGNLYISGTYNLTYIPVDSNGDPVSSNEFQIDSCCGDAYGLAIDSANNLYRPDITNANYDGTPCGVAKYTYNSPNNFTKSCIGSGWVHPSSVTVDASFNVYVLDASPGTIYKLTPSGGGYTKTTLYGPDTALVGTTGISMDSAGNFYITSGPNTGTISQAKYAENSTPAVYKLTLSGGIYTRSSLGTGWDSPSATTVDFEGNVWVSDYGANEIYVLIPSGSTYTQTRYTSINNLRTLVTNKAGQLYGLAASSGDAVIWTGGSEPHTVTPPPPGGTSTAPVTISFPVPTTVTGYTVVTNGSSGQEFTDGGGDNCPPGTYSAGDSCTVNVSFTPQSPGLSTGALVLYGNDNAVLGTDYFYGVGQGPMVAFNPAVISTDVGTGNACNGTLSTCGDTSAATAATLNNPNSVIFDAAGDLYIADTADYAVREVTPTGTITTIAGTGSQCASASGTCGDGGAATSATFTSPTGLALDGAGNLYIVDAGANRIREVAAGTGIITTIAGTGTACSSPTAACGDTGAASSATFNMEGYGGAVVDPNANLVIADYGDNRLRSINLNTGVITTVAGTGVACSTSTATCGDGGQAISAQLNGPTGVGIDSSGDYFIADSNDNRIRELSALTSDLSTVAGSGTACTTSPCGDGGAATSAQLNFPLMATTDPAGNVYIADSKDNAIRMVSSATNKISAVAGSYTACATSTAACGDGGAAPSAQLNTPSGLALNAPGNIYIADATDRIHEVNITQTVPLIFPQTNPGSTSAAMSVSFTNIGNAALTFSVSPSFPTGFEEDGTTICAASLAEDATCTLAIDFAPAALENYSGNLMLTDNDLNATTTPGTQQTIALSGSAIDPVPTVTGISPVIGLFTGGTSVTITGTGFTGATGVSFGGAAAVSFIVNSATSITAISPAGSGTVDVTVTTPGGTSPTSSADQFIYQQAQTILFAPPATGVAVSSVTLTATGGASGNPVTFSVISGLATASGTNGSTLTYIGSGTVVVEADQAGAAGYAAAAPEQSSIAVAAAPATYTAPTTAVGSTSATQTVYVNFTTAGTLGSISVLTQGATGLDFTDAVSGDTCSVGTTYSAGAVCVVNVIFTPQYAGPRYGAVVLKNGSGNVLGSAYVSGVGTGSQITFANTTQGKYTPNSISTLGGSFGFSNPLGVAIDASGDVYIADTGNHAVEEMSAGCALSTCVTTLGGDFQFNSPYGVAVDGAGNVFVSDNGKHEVYELLAAGGYTTVNPLGNSTSNSNPKGIAVDGAGNVYVAGSNNAVYEIPVTGGYATAIELGGGFLNPSGVAVDAAGDVFVSDDNNLEIKEMPAGCASSACVRTLVGSDYPSGMAIDGAGDVYFADGSLTEVLVGGGYATARTLPSGTSAVTSVAVDSKGDVFFTNAGGVEELGYATPPSLTYATSTLVGRTDTTDGTQTVTVSNIGNTALTFSSVAYPADFSEPSGASGACSTSAQLATGAGCTLPVNFTPTSTTGPLSENLVLTDNNLNATVAPGTQQTIALSGTGIPAPTATQAVAVEVLTESHVATSFVPVTGSGGTGTLAYSVSPGLPAGLVLNAGTGAITGTPTVTSAAASYTVTVTDANGATATASFSLTVNSAVAAVQAIGVGSLTFYQAIVPFLPVTGSGGTAPLSYSVLPGLPAGLVLNAGTGVISGTPTAVSAAASYTVTVTDANGETATASFSLGVAQQATVTVVSASPATATPVQAVTLSATVVATVAGTPGSRRGTVTFFDGATQLGAAAPLSGGTAQLIVTSLPPGQAAVITAVYSGDRDFLGSTSGNSASVVVGPLDFTFTNTGTAAYTAAPGAVASYSFGLAPLYGSYAGPVSFTVTGLPTGAVASFTPSSVAADRGAVPVPMTVQTATAMAHLGTHKNSNHGNSPLGRGIVLALLLLPFGMKRRLREKLRGRMLLLLLLLAGMTAAVTGCGSNNGFMLESPGSYTLTVTASSGTLQHSQTVTLIVQ